ncbi:hypothetical protein TrRE_jg5653 [Triparma retinervis]|uniref:Uncharacterized protein n=1 Tax=Triparma retinervis TaxID=2557542 RepID=A0A9W7EEX4_9STRA|nr:hypothetical protein TrRE_jg5653 [Triparma retinervis]
MPNNDKMSEDKKDNKNEKKKKNNKKDKKSDKNNNKNNNEAGASPHAPKVSSTNLNLHARVTSIIRDLRANPYKLPWVPVEQPATGVSCDDSQPVLRCEGSTCPSSQDRHMAPVSKDNQGTPPEMMAAEILRLKDAIAKSEAANAILEIDNIALRNAAWKSKAEQNTVRMNLKAAASADSEAVLDVIDAAQATLKATNVKLTSDVAKNVALIASSTTSAKADGARKGVSFARSSEQTISAQDEILLLQNKVEDLQVAARLNNTALLSKVPSNFNAVSHQELADSMIERGPVLGTVEKGRLAFWQHFMKGGLIIEYLVKVTRQSVPSQDGTSVTLDLKSVNEMDLPKRLRNLVPTRTSNKAQRAKVDGELRLKPHEHGQCAFTLVGSLEIEEKEGQAMRKVTASPGQLSPKMGKRARALGAAVALGKMVKNKHNTVLRKHGEQQEWVRECKQDI